MNKYAAIWLVLKGLATLDSAGANEKWDINGNETVDDDPVFEGDATNNVKILLTVP